MLLNNYLNAIADIKESKNTYYLIIENEKNLNDFLLYLSSLDHFKIVNLDSGNEINIFFRLLKRLFANTNFYDILPMYESERIAKKLLALDLDILHFLTRHFTSDS